VVTSWTDVRFDHADAKGSCFSCHNNDIARGKPPTHVPSTNQCGACHVTTAWTQVAFDHADAKGSCFSCHNNDIARGKPPTHMRTNNDCADCHRPEAWTPVSYTHIGIGFADHGSSLGCLACHSSGSQRVVWKFPAQQPDCGGCHANDFRAASHPKFETPAPTAYRATELRDCTGACHIYTDASMTVVKESRSSHHRATTGAW
jgi:hypothetical protein